MFITFGTLSSHFWYIILTSVFYTIRNKLLFEDNYQKIISGNPLSSIFSKEIGKTFTLILYFTLWRKKKTSYKNLNQKNHSLSDKLIITALIIIITCSNLLLNIVSVRGIGSSLLKPAFNGILILIISGLSMLMLNQKYHRHHSLGLGILFIGLIVRYCFSKPPKEINNLSIVFILSLIEMTALAFQEVGEKYLMDKKYFHPLLVLGLEGIVGIFLILVIIIIYSPFHCSYPIENEICRKDSLDDFLDKMKQVLTSYYIIYFLFQILLTLLSNVFRIYSTFYLTPTHRILSMEIEYLLVLVINSVYNLFCSSKDDSSSKNNVFIELIMLIDEIIGVLIFVELIIVRVCGMNKNVASEISKREITESNIVDIDSLTIIPKEYIITDEIEDKNEGEKNNKNDYMF